MIRLGDIVEFEWQARNRETRGYKYIKVKGIVDGTEKDSWCIKGHIGIHNRKRSIRVIEDIKKVKLIKKREEIKDWWNYL